LVVKKILLSLPPVQQKRVVLKNKLFKFFLKNLKKNLENKKRLLPLQPQTKGVVKKPQSSLKV